MKVFWFYLGWVALQLVAQEKILDPFPSKLETKKGLVFYDCKLKRVETDALIIEHRDGVAKVLMFDLDESFQIRYQFDPVAAMEKYKIDQKVQREEKWQRFWEAQQYQATAAEQEELQKLREYAKSFWTPIEATIRKTTKDGIYVSAKRITFVPTKTKSTLGFEIDGPLIKKLVPFDHNVIFIRNTNTNRGLWEGYVETFPTGTAPLSSYQGQESQVPSYRGVARSEIK
jgi:type II secretory ATPase GspE/PulE/Tfp pilus assembly ATPase PilB-like protein